MRRAKPGKGYLLIIVVAVLAMIAIPSTYLFASTKLEEVKVVYEKRIQVITSRAKEFADNLSIALTYMDTARDDLKNARLNLEKTIFWMDEKEYDRMRNSSFDAIFYFNRSNALFRKSLSYLLYSKNSSTKEYEKVLDLYINYTRSAINLTHYGVLISRCLENVSISRAEEWMEDYEELKEYYDRYDEEMRSYLIQIKDYCGIRE
ncbi:MAG TPA: hypothetical protein ENG60_02820 [Thermoplasmatales archaeon]|nr:hypothetical protein [Thermoplasmatales archaeon]HEX17327.1 hypothetical protein [Thermoplasmatales archaeon]